MVPVEIVTDGTTPVTTGNISQALNLDGSALLVAEEGVFSSAGDRLVYHPISEFMADLESPRLFGGSRSTDGTLAMWVLSADGDFRLTDGTVHQWTVPALDTSTGLSLAVESDGVALLGQDAAARRADPRGRRGSRPHDAHGHRQLRRPRRTSRLYLGGEHGVLVRGPDASFRHYTLGSERGTPGSSVRQLLARPGGGVYVLLDAAVAVLDDSPTADGAPPASRRCSPSSRRPPTSPPTATVTSGSSVTGPSASPTPESPCPSPRRSRPCSGRPVTSATSARPRARPSSTGPTTTRPSSAPRSSVPAPRTVPCHLRGPG